MSLFLYNNYYDGGTEYVAKNVEKYIIPKCKTLQKIQWILIPGHILNFDLNKFTIVWVHLPSSMIKIESETYKQFFTNKNIVSKINIYLVQSEWHKNDISNSFKIDKNKIFVIPNGYDADSFYLKENKNKILKLIFTSSCYRGLENLNKSLKYSKENFIISAKECECGYCNIVNLDKRIILRKRLDKKEYIEEINSANILVYPGNWDETFCIVLVECLGAGLKTIISDVGALPEISNNFATIIKYNDKDFIKNFGLAIDNEVRQYNKFNALNQYNTIKNLYSWENVKKYWTNLDNTVKNMIV